MMGLNADHLVQLFTALSALSAAVITYMNNRAIKEAKLAIKSDIKEVKKDVNGRTDQLITATQSISRIEGKLEGIQQEKDDQKARDDHKANLELVKK